MKRLNTKYDNDEDVVKPMEEEEARWPYPVHTGSEADHKQLELVVNKLSPASKKRLWDYICKEDASLAALLKQVKVFETREHINATGKKVVIPSEGFGVNMNLLNDGALLQQTILQQEHIDQQ